VIFKGSGFYTTDYARKGKAAQPNGSDGAKSDSKDAKDGGSKSDSSSSSSDSGSSSGSGEKAASGKD